MAQFSSVTGIEAMRVSLDNFVSDQASSKMLDAAALVGRTAVISSNEAQLDHDKPVSLEYTLPHATESTTASFTDASGALVHRMNLGNRDSGTHSLRWDGTLANNKQAAPGPYTVSVEYPNGEGNSSVAELSVATTVKSVNLGAGGTDLTISTSEGRK